MQRIKELESLALKKEKSVNRKLYNHYKKALKDLKKQTKYFVDEVEKLSPSEKLSIHRKRKMAIEIDKIMRGLSNESQLDMRDFLKDRAVDGFLGVMYDLENKVGFGFEFDMLPEKYIETLVNKKVSGKTYSQRLYEDRTKLAKVVKQELLDGALNGEGYAKIAKNIAENTESSYKQAVRIARTEGHRVQTETTQKGYEEAEDLGIELKKQWLASLDDSTRDEHSALDGQTVGIDEEFEIDGYRAVGPGMFGEPEMDINCRCTTITIVNNIEPKLRRDNINKEVIEYKDYNQWKKGRGA